MKFIPLDNTDISPEFILRHIWLLVRALSSAAWEESLVKVSAGLQDQLHLVQHSPLPFSTGQSDTPAEDSQALTGSLSSSLAAPLSWVAMGASYGPSILVFLFYNMEKTKIASLPWGHCEGKPVNAYGMLGTWPDPWQEQGPC